MCTVGCSQYFQNKECKYITKNLSLFYDILPYDASDITPGMYRKFTTNTLLFKKYF